MPGISDKVQTENKHAADKVLLCGAAFAAYTIMSSLSAMDIIAAAKGGNVHVSSFYALILLSTAVGFILFGLVLNKRSFMQTSMISAAALFIVTMTMVYFFPNAVNIYLPGILCALATGVVGGGIYYITSETLCGNAHMGLTVGGAYGASVIVQYFVQNYAKGNIPRMTIMVIALVIILWEIRNAGADSVCGDRTDTGKAVIPESRPGECSESMREHRETITERADERGLWILAATVAAVALMTGIYDGMAAELNAANKMNLSGWPRILLGIGTLVAGYLFDIWHKEYLNIIVLCVSIINTINVILLVSEQTYLLSQVLVYASMGFYIFYLIGSFIDAAPQSSKPAFWAGAGRMVYLIAMAATTSLAGAFESVSPVTMDIIMMILLLIVFIMFVLKGGFMARNKSAAVKSITAEDKFYILSVQYGLTPREIDVLGAVSSSEKTLASIASDLGISERVLQRHLSSIYKKTGTQTRNGLSIALHGINK